MDAPEIVAMGVSTRRWEYRKRFGPRLPGFLALWFASVLFPQAGVAQRVAPVPAELLVKSRFLGETTPIAISPDGKWVAYMVRDNSKNRCINEDETYVRTGLDCRVRGGEIWLTNTETRKTRVLEGGSSSSWEPTWSPDGGKLAFLSDRDGSGQAKLWVWDARKDELRMVSEARVRARPRLHPILWGRNSEKILIAAIPADLSTSEYAGRILSAMANGRPAASTVLVYRSGVEEQPGEHRAAPDTNLDLYHLHDIVSVDLATGRTETIIHNFRIGRYALSPDGLKVAYAIPKRLARPGALLLAYDLAVVDLNTGKQRVLVPNIELHTFSWSPDGRLIGYGEYGDNDTSYSFSVVTANGDEVRKVSALPRQPYCCLPRIPMWNREGTAFYFILNGALWRTDVTQSRTEEFARVPGRAIVSSLWQSANQMMTTEGGRATIVITHDPEGKQDGFYRIDLVSGSTKKLLERGECYICKWRGGANLGPYFAGASLDGSKASFLAENAERPPDLWVSDVQFERATQLTHLNPELDTYKTGAARVIDWLSDDGDRLHGALLLPSNYEARKRYPLVVWVYPTLLSDSFNEYGFGGLGYLNMQLLATRGYAVLFPDAPKKIGEQMMSMPKDVLPGVSKVVEMGIADPHRLAVMGHSYGGWATMALITQTRRFQAAVEMDGPADLVAFYGVMQPDGSVSRVSQGESIMIGATPWQAPLKYLENSPIHYLDRVETPLLIIQGSEDEESPSFLADEVFVGLRRLGKRVEYAKYVGENHATNDWNYANQVDFLHRVVDWLDAYLMPEGRQ
jgi:dipeptidyl aminopeptidase/acylaminoacyl peptidase